jgi:hypothetical protein
MENPWLRLNFSGPSYVLDADRDHVQHHNDNPRLHPEHRLMLDAIPEPFIGDPTTARVVLLGLNPGHDGTVPVTHGRAEIKAAIFRNLRHEHREYPFYAFDPVFRDTGVAEWWRKYTRALQREAGLDDRTLAQRLLVIEWLPYASTRFRLRSNAVWESQKYSFHLAQRMLVKQGVQVIGMRSRALWLRAIPELIRVPFLRNPQNPCISGGNMERDAYDRVIQALTA